MEVVSGCVTPEQVWQEAQEIVALFTDLGVSDLIVYYGFGCDCEIEQQYQDTKVRTKDLLSFLSRSISRGYYHLAVADLYIESRPLGVRFLLCHESDVHLETQNEQILDRTKTRWSRMGHLGYEKTDDVWVPLTVMEVPDANSAISREPVAVPQTF